MLNELKQKVYKANLRLKELGLIIQTWGNASEIDRVKGLVVIKPSGVPYEDLSPDKMVVVDFDGNVINSDFCPSSDVKTHIELYKGFESIQAVVHTHSIWATTMSQAGMGIRPLGTTHADYFYGEVPCTRVLNEDEVKEDYELMTGKLIVETFKDKEPSKTPGVLVRNHGPFTWGANSFEAVRNAEALECIAKMAFHNIQLDTDVASVPQYVLDKHYFRKHGQNAYYGQKATR